MPRKLTQEQVIQQFISVHGDLYDYSLVIYKGNFDKVKIKCESHGVFNQNPADHKLGKGCPTCKGTKRKSTSQFIKEAKSVHGNTYKYDSTIYKSAHDKVKIYCYIHGYFMQSASHHLNRCGCPKCHNFQVKYYNKPTKVYFLHIKDNIYKIGITIRDVKERIDELDYPGIKVIRTKQFDTGKQAYEYEQRLLRKFYKYRYEGLNLLSSGNSELLELSIK